MAFLDLTFPHGIAAGVTGGPERRVDIVALASGDEERNARWKNSRRSYDASLGVRDVDDAAQVIALFEETGGPLHSFRFRDWSDFSSALTTRKKPTALDQTIGTGDGVTTVFQLTKSYGTLTPYQRDISKPVAGTVLVALDLIESVTGWVIDQSTGQISFDVAPASGVQISAGFLFDVPVRFDAQRLDLDMAFFSESEGRGLGSIPEVPLIEVRE